MESSLEVTSILECTLYLETKATLARLIWMTLKVAPLTGSRRDSKLREKELLLKHLWLSISQSNALGTFQMLDSVSAMGTKTLSDLPWKIPLLQSQPSGVLLQGISMSGAGTALFLVRTTKGLKHSTSCKSVHAKVTRWQLISMVQLQLSLSPRMELTSTALKEDGTILLKTNGSLQLDLPPQPLREKSCFTKSSRRESSLNDWLHFKHYFFLKTQGHNK